MPFKARQLRVVLGDHRVLREHDGDPQHRVTAHCPRGRIVAAAVLQPLYGSSAEVALAVEDPTDHGLIEHILGSAVARAREIGISTLRIVPTPEQHALADAIGGERGLSGVLTIPCEAS